VPLYKLSQVVLGDQINGKMVFSDIDLRMPAHLFGECPLNLLTGIVLVMEDPVF
jgi:hypothetical protein